MHRKILAVALAAAGLVSANAAMADDQPFMVRARAVYVDFDNGQNNLPVKVEADSRWIPEVDLSYFFTPNIAAELVLTYPQNVDIKVAGSKAGTIKALPPSLMLQYHVTQLGAFKPYVGLGLNYTMFTKHNNILGGAAEVDSSSFGVAGQVGFDYMITKNWALNVDLKYIKMDTDVKVNGNKIGTLDLNPITAGIGVGYRF
jgi:outer membrane protein